VLHSVFAAVWFKNLSEKRMRRHYQFYRLYYTLFAFAGFAALIIYLLVAPSYKVFLPTTATNVIGAVIAVFGGSVMLLCIKKYFMQLSGLRSLVENRNHDQLMITGIHNYVRHPLYAGTFLFIWGLWILVPSMALLISNVVITVYTIIGIRFEEQKLEKQFGEAYREYRSRTPMLIPRF
jgi:methanethiol S-methyltransferase